MSFRKRVFAIQFGKTLLAFALLQNLYFKAKFSCYSRYLLTSYFCIPVRYKEKTSFQKTKIMASGSNTSWEIDGETVETVSDFIFWGSKLTADGDFSHEIKRHLLLGRKGMINLDSILKSRDITLSTKVCLVKAMVCPVVMYGCESWTIKKAKH